MSFNNIKLWARLSLAFSALLALQVLMAVAALREMREIQHVQARQAVLAASRQDVFEWNALTRANVIRAVMLAKAGSPKDLAEWTGAEMKATSARISVLQKGLETGLSDPKALALMGDVGKARKAYLDLRAGLMARMAQPGQVAAAQADIDSQMLPSAAGYLKTLDAVLAHVDLQLSSHAQTMAADLRRAMTSLMVLSAVALALGALLAWLVARSLVRPIRTVIASARNIATGDLTHDIVQTRGDELGDLQLALREMQDCLRKMVAGIRSGTESVGVATTQIASGNLDLSARTEQAASSLQQTAATMSQLTDTARQSASSAQEAHNLAGTAAGVARRGGDVVSQVVTTMSEIHAGSSRISEITGVIDGIAFQTNILALNAAVEAARAGEQGRGFAVVAAEVRSLAGRSADAAREIKALIGASVEKVGTGTQLVRDAGATMDEIVQSVARVTQALGGVTAASEGQSGSINEINQAVGQLDQITQQNAALVEEAAAAAQSLKEQAAGLTRMVTSFRLAPGFA
jgi:methyl-accepting chemotaxis protein